MMTIKLVLLALIASLTVQAKVIFIGDSHSLGVFGEEINTYLEESLHDYEFWASGASAPLQWINNAFTTSCGYNSKKGDVPKRGCPRRMFTPTLISRLQASPGAHHVIVALGTNFGKTEDHRRSHIRYTTKMLKKLRADDKCLWIGPPDMKRRRDRSARNYGIIEESIRKSGVDCKLIYSDRFTQYPESTDHQRGNPDGIHYDYPAAWYRFPEGKIAALKWAQDIIPFLNDFLRD